MEIRLVADIAQGVGGLAGLVALSWQIVDVLRRRRRGHWPPELRSVLLAVLRVSKDVDASPQARTWAVENIRPLKNELQHLALLLDGRKHHGDRKLLERVSLGVRGIEIYALDEQYMKRTPEEAVRDSLKQQECANEARAAALEVLRRMGLGFESNKLPGGDSG